ncbi:hypothetical protein [Mesorhizobium neociceri]|uniref:hypothetical protein n=1 Tax=Mesorhizobium neociceri TaxID=1307853 RepID=UPI002E27D4B2|nr:hypothetical protein [Mesorhizobium neociceri]
MPLHMDGACFANVLTTLACSPAEMTWSAGVDLLSFGATKNGTFGSMRSSRSAELSRARSPFGENGPAS